MSRITALCEWLLRQAVVWGGMACFAFYVLVVQHLPASSALRSAFAGNGAELKLVAAFLFFVGVASLAIKLFSLVVQFGGLAAVDLAPAPAEGQTVSDVEALLAKLHRTPAPLRKGYLWQRVFGALNFVKQNRTADGLEHQLNRLEDADIRSMTAGYGAVRMILAMIVAVGVLGGAVGLSTALARLSAAGADASIGELLARLSLALNPIAQALGLSIALFFIKFGVQRVETRLLSAVGDSTASQLLGRFRQYGAENDPHIASIKRMSEQVLQTVETAAARHEAALAKSLGAASRRWEEMATTAAELIQRTVGETLVGGLKDHANALNEGVARHTADLERTLVRHAEILSENIDCHAAAMADALEHHAAVMTETEKSVAAESGQRLADMEAALGEAMLVAATRQEKLIQQSEDLLKEMQVALVESAGSTVAQQEQLVKQSDVLLKVVEATGQIRELETALNHNLASLSGAHNFEQTAASLAAAVQLLAARLHQPLVVHHEVDLGEDPRAGHAA